MTDIEDLAKRISDLTGRVESITRTSQIANTSLSQGGETTDISDTVLDAQDSAATIPGLQELLDANESALAANSAAVAEALIAATQASADGIAAGELAAAAADVALDRAQEALDAAASAGGGATYTGRAPTAADPGVQGQQWFVWDSNYHVTAYYVYDGGTSAWVQTQITDAVLGNISAGVITSGYLSSARIATASLTAAVLAADTLTSREIGADAILARNIKAGQVTATAIAASTITGDKIAANTITAGNIAAGSITANEIAANSITATQINLDSLSGKTITGATIKTAASGARLEFLRTQIDVYNADNTAAASIRGDSLGGVSGSIYLQGIYLGKSGGMQVFGAATETARTGSAITAAGGIGATNGDISATTTTLAPGYRAQQVMISPEFWVARPSGSPGRRERRAMGGLTTPGGYDITFGAFQRVSYSYFNPSTQLQTDVPVIFGAENSNPTTVTVQADEYRTRDRVLNFADSGWLTPSTQTGAGYSANTLRYRKVGNQVWWVGQLNRSSAMAAGTVGSVPVAYAPSLPGGDSRMVVAATATAGTLLRIAFYPDGHFEILDISGGSSTYALFHGITYLTD